MALIDDEERARKLARAILADIKLNSRGERSVEELLISGREMFRKRVIPALGEVFEQVLMATPIERGPG